MNGFPTRGLPSIPSSSSKDANAIDHDENACTDADEFPRAVAKTAVAQICESVGFHSAQLSALETLADIAIRYLCDTGKASQFYANLAGRTQSNALDALCAVEDINGVGLTDVGRGMPSADTQLKGFVDYGEESPFCKPVTHFPIRKKQALTPSFSQLGEKPPRHIPPWLPAFPDAHTYKATPVWNERKIDPRVDKLEQAKQRRKAERSLVSLHLHLSTSEASSSDGAIFMMAAPEECKPSHFLSSELLESNNEYSVGFSNEQNSGSQHPSSSIQNPLLFPSPLADAKEVSALPFNGAKPPLSTSNIRKIEGPVVLPSILEAFTPALEAATLNVRETSGMSNTLRGFVPTSMKRKPLSMRFDYGGRARERAVTANLSLGGKQRKKVLPELKDDEKDEKKKRVEQILAQSLGGNETMSNDRH